MTTAQLLSSFPGIHFARGKTFVWSPAKKTVFYDPTRVETPLGGLALLHEIGHAELGHTSYELDTELIDMEVAAWEEAKELATKLAFQIDHSHIEECLETYRLWLYKRSRCPKCDNTGLQVNGRTYSCFLCGSQWQVASSHSLQPRRMKCNIPKIT